MVVGGEAGERCGAVLMVLGVAERSGASGEARTSDATPRAGSERRRRRRASTGKRQRGWRGEQCTRVGAHRGGARGRGREQQPVSSRSGERHGGRRASCGARVRARVERVGGRPQRGVAWRRGSAHRAPRGSDVRIGSFERSGDRAGKWFELNDEKLLKNFSA